MSRRIVRVRCERCDRDFKSVHGSVAFNEKLCNVCAGVPVIVGATPTLGWPLGARSTATPERRHG